MKVTRIEKETLLDIVEENKEKYVAILKEARTAYLAKAKEELSTALSNVTAFNSVFISIEAPVDNTAAYDKIIQKLELTTDTIIELDSNEFDQFVNNEWRFVQHLGMLTESYSN